jgi:hypothetical protein
LGVLLAGINNTQLDSLFTVGITKERIVEAFEVTYVLDIFNPLLWDIAENRSNEDSGGMNKVCTCLSRPTRQCYLGTYSLVRLSVIARKSAQFDIAFFKLLLTLASFAKFGGTNWSVIGRMHKDDTPRVAQVFIQIKGIRILSRPNQVRELLFVVPKSSTARS